MLPNLKRYKEDIERLISVGEELHIALMARWLPSEFDEAMREREKNPSAVRKTLPSFANEYQAWYSEAQALVKMVLPDRLSDFVGHYKTPKARKEVDCENYRIEDCVLGTAVTRRIDGELVVGPSGAIPHVRQQLAIVNAARARFESTLFEIRQLVQADLFDSELVAAEELARNNFIRAAGAIAGVVLERHLRQVCEDHDIRLRKKAGGISGSNDALKKDDLVDVPTWRFVQHLADIRNLCDHSKDKEPTAEQVDDLITGVKKVVKTVF